jgi:hypothetical protein
MTSGLVCGHDLDEDEAQRDAMRMRRRRDAQRVATGSSTPVHGVEGAFDSAPATGGGGTRRSASSRSAGRLASAPGRQSRFEYRSCHTTTADSPHGT